MVQLHTANWLSHQELNEMRGFHTCW